MSLTLKTASATTVVLTLANRLMNGYVFQKIGTSFMDVLKLTQTQNINSANTAKSRVVIKIPYNYTVGTETFIDFVPVSIEMSIKETCPQTVTAQIPWLVQSYAADQSFADLCNSRSHTAS